MAGSPHGSARTTPRVRAELQASQEATSTLAQRYRLSRTTVAWNATASPGCPKTRTRRQSEASSLRRPSALSTSRRQTLRVSAASASCAWREASSTWSWRPAACPRRNRSVCAGFTYVEFRDDAGKMNGAEFPRGAVEAFPYAIHTVLTDNGMAFADLPKNRTGPTRRCLGAHIFDFNPRHLIPGPNTHDVPSDWGGQR